MGGSRNFKKEVGRKVGHHGWPTKKILGFKWSTKAKITLETIGVWEMFLLAFSNFIHFYIQ